MNHPDMNKTIAGEFIATIVFLSTVQLALPTVPNPLPSYHLKADISLADNFSLPERIGFSSFRESVEVYMADKSEETNAGFIEYLQQ